MTWNYRIVREPEGLFIREVFYLDNGEIGGCSQDPITPFGHDLQDLTNDLATLQAALQLPILNLDEIDKAAQKPAIDHAVGPNMSLATLRAELNQDLDEPFPEHPSSSHNDLNDQETINSVDSIAHPSPALPTLISPEFADLFRHLLRETIQDVLSEILTHGEVNLSQPRPDRQ